MQTNVYKTENLSLLTPGSRVWRRHLVMSPDRIQIRSQNIKLNRNSRSTVHFLTSDRVLSVYKLWCLHLMISWCPVSVRSWPGPAGSLHTLAHYPHPQPCPLIGQQRATLASHWSLDDMLASDWSVLTLTLVTRGWWVTDMCHQDELTGHCVSLLPHWPPQLLMGHRDSDWLNIHWQWWEFSMGGSFLRGITMQ